MAKPQTLIATERARTGSGVLKRMRREGFIPAVIYGGGEESKNVKVDTKTFTDMLNHAASDSILVNLEIEGGEAQLAFLQDVQHNALSGQIMHIDFLAVDKNTSITANIPVEIVGDSEGVAAGGVLDQQIHTLEISCLPKDLPESIEADITKLQIGEALTVGDIAYPDGVTPSLDAGVAVVMIGAPRVAAAADEDATDGDAPTEPEVTSEKDADDSEG